MLATGGSASAAAQFNKSYNTRSIRLKCIIAAPEGIEKKRRITPTSTFTPAVDERLNEHGYIVRVWATRETGFSNQIDSLF
jgi:uracil phosphoribosyltransferase